MSERYLFGAQADQIQETLFRASRLRQVVGGSRLIAEFGDQARALAEARGATVLITGGGNFRAIFSTLKESALFGDDLADCYAQVLGASLTTAGAAVPMKGDFRNESIAIFEAIQRRKRSKRGRQTTEQTPTTAFCQYSGTGLAGDLVRRPRETRSDYVSSAVELMQDAGKRARDSDKNSFLGRIAEHLPVDQGLPPDWPDGDTRDGVEEIEALDPEHRNVAYLLADGNGMGKLFKKCDSPEQLTELADALDEAMRVAVANPIADLFKRLNQARANAMKSAIGFLPVLPLILAGDDAFVFLPAHYALDYARRFCLAFEVSMLESLNKSEALRPLLPFAPTIGAAVVICKGSFPYRIAYQRGKERLEEAKRLSKTVAQATRRSAGNEERLSAVGFEMITGNELVGEAAPEKPFQSELRPYWAQEQVSDVARAYGISLVTFLSQRLEFKDTPGKRLAELREFYDPEALPADIKKLNEEWEPWLSRLKERMDATEPKSSETVRWVLEALGDNKGVGLGCWRAVRRAKSGEEKIFYANGLADLIEVWNYAQLLDKEMEDYEREDARDER